MSAVATAQDGSMYLADAVHHRILRVSSSGEISVVAGTGSAGFAGDGGRASRAVLNAPAGLALDAAGNLYFTDSGNGRVRRIDRNGRIDTVAAGLGLPYGLTVDVLRNLYVADSGHHRIYLISQEGTLQALAGKGTAGFSGDGGPALEARINSPIDVAVTRDGVVYFSDAGNGRVRQIRGDRTIQTVAQDLNVPAGLAADNAGNIFIAESGKNRILRLSPDGRLLPEISTGLLLPRSLSLDASGTLFVADLGGARRADSGGQGPAYSTAIGSRTASATLAGLAPASVAPGSASFTLTVNGSGFGADSVVLWNGSSRPTTFVSATQVTASIGAADVTTTGAGLVSVFTGGIAYGPMPLFVVPAFISSWVAGGGYNTGSGGTAVNALLTRPTGVAFDSVGNMYIADSGAHVIRRVDSSGIITTVAGTGTGGFSGDGGPATSAQLNTPLQLAFDSLGYLYVTDQANGRVRRFTPGGTISTFAGGGSQTGEGVAATSLSLYQTNGLIIDSLNNVYVGSSYPFVVRKITPGGVATTFAGGGASTTDGVAATSFQLNATGAFAIDAFGNFYVADASAIRKINSTGIISRIAGSASSSYSFAGDGGLGTDASLYYPSGLAFDPAGNLYIADSNNGRVRFVSANGYITTVAGGGLDNTVGGGGLALQATLPSPTGLARDSSGALFLGCGSYNGFVAKLFVPNAAAPSIGLLSPSNPTAGSPGFSLFVTGSGFTASSVVQWNGSNRTTTFVSPSQLSAVISASDVTVGGNIAVRVFSPASGASATRYYIVLNPIPTIATLSPDRILTGTGVTLTLTGTNFNQNSVVVFGYTGSPLPTTFVSPTQLTATLAASQTAQASTTNIMVRNPAPGGGTASAPMNIQSSAAILTVGGDSSSFYRLRSESLGEALGIIRLRNNTQVNQTVPGGSSITLAFDAPLVGSPTVVGSSAATANIFTDGGSTPATPARVSASASLNVLTVNILQDLTIVPGSSLTIQGVRINANAAAPGSTTLNVQVSAAPLDALALNVSFYSPTPTPVTFSIGTLAPTLSGPNLRTLSSPPVFLGTTATANPSGSSGPSVLYQSQIPTTPVLSSGTISSLPPGITGVDFAFSGMLTSMAMENGLTPLAPVTQGTRVTLSLSGMPAGITLFVPQILGSAPSLTLVSPATGSLYANALGTQLQAYTPDVSGNVTFTYETTISSNPSSFSPTVNIPLLLTLNTGASLPLGSFGSATMSVGPTTGGTLLRFVSNSTAFSGALFSVVTAPPAVTVASLTPSSPSMTPGSTITMAVVLNRNNFTGIVTLGVSGTLPGIATSITQPGTGNTATIVFQALQNAPASTLSLSVTVSGSGIATASTPFTLLVTSAQGSVSPSYVPALPGTAFSIPIRLNLNTNITANSLTFGVRLLPSGGAPALGGSLTFTRDAAISEVPTTDTGGLADSLTVAWPSLATALSGNRILGTINGTVPAGAALGQSYAVQVTGASAALGTASVSLSYGVFGSVSVTNVIFRVGDVYPYTGDVAPNFGDGNLNVLDLVQELFAVNNVPGYAPALCSDRADAMDLYPPDGATRGGDGVLNVLDLTRQLFRVNNLDMDRPQRATLSGVCAHAVENTASRRNWDHADATVTLGSPLREGGTERVPVFLQVNRPWNRVAFTFAAGDGRRQWNFVPVANGAAPLVHSGTAGVVAVAWLDGLSVLVGERLLLGYIESPAGVVADLELYGMSANSLDDGQAMRLNFPRTAVR